LLIHQITKAGKSSVGFLIYPEYCLWKVDVIFYRMNYFDCILSSYKDFFDEVPWSAFSFYLIASCGDFHFASEALSVSSHEPTALVVIALK
jgi:hypothetical protein